MNRRAITAGQDRPATHAVPVGRLRHVCGLDAIAGENVEGRLALIDDDPAVLDSLRLYFARQNVETSCFDAAENFLAAVGRAESFDCVVSDVRMPGVSGLDLVRQLNARGYLRPIIMITGQGDIDMAVAAIKAISSRSRSTRIAFSPALTRRWSVGGSRPATPRARFEQLSRRQRQVMELAATGLSSKEIGAQLKISAKTVENHRVWVMERIGARNLAELVRMAMRLQQKP